MFYSFSVISKDAPSPIQRNTIYFLGKFHSVLDISFHIYLPTYINRNLFLPTTPQLQLTFVLILITSTTTFLCPLLSPPKPKYYTSPLATTSNNETYFLKKQLHTHIYPYKETTPPNQKVVALSIHYHFFKSMHKEIPIEKMK